jgi:hypothetical protein
VPIDFRDAADFAELGTAAFLRIEREASSRGFRGALLVINARGEPLDFVYCRVETKYSSLWRARDIARHATKELAKSLFATCSQNPRILLCVTTEIDSTLFSEDLPLSIPVGRASIADTSDNAPLLVSPDATDSDRTPTILWVRDHPPASFLATRLFNELTRRGLIQEPLERARRGLHTVYPDRSAS